MTLINGTSKKTIEELSAGEETKPKKKSTTRKKTPKSKVSNLVTVYFDELKRTPFMMQTAWEEMIKANVQRHSNMSWDQSVHKHMIGFGEFNFFAIDGHRWFVCRQGITWVYCQMWFKRGKKAKENPAVGYFSILTADVEAEDAISHLTSPFDVPEADQRKIVARILENKQYDQPPTKFEGNL